MIAFDTGITYTNSLSNYLTEMQTINIFNFNFLGGATMSICETLRPHIMSSYI